MSVYLFKNIPIYSWFSQNVSLNRQTKNKCLDEKKNNSYNQSFKISFKDKIKYDFKLRCKANKNC